MSMGMINKDTAATIPAAGNTGDKVGNLAALHTTAKSDIVSAVNEVKDEQANKADNDIVADAFNAAETYAEGDYCTYEGGLYKFKASHSGAWDAADVDQIQIAGELSELKNTLNTYTYTDIASEVTNKHSSVSQVHYVYVMTYGKLCIIGLSFTTSAATPSWSTFFAIPVTNIRPVVNPSCWDDLYISSSGYITSRVPLTAGDHYYQLVYLIH